MRENQKKTILYINFNTYLFKKLSVIFLISICFQTSTTIFAKNISTNNCPLATKILTESWQVFEQGLIQEVKAYQIIEPNEQITISTIDLPLSFQSNKIAEYKSYSLEKLYKNIFNIRVKKGKNIPDSSKKMYYSALQKAYNTSKCVDIQIYAYQLCGLIRRQLNDINGAEKDFRRVAQLKQNFSKNNDYQPKPTSLATIDFRANPALFTNTKKQNKPKIDINSNISIPKHINFIAINIPQSEAKYAQKDAIDIALFFENQGSITQDFSYENINELQKITTTKDGLSIIFLNAFGPKNQEIFEGIRQLKGKKLVLFNLFQNKTANKKHDILKYIKEHLIIDINTTIILSNQSDQEAHESDMWKNSAFVEAILQGLYDGTPDSYNIDNQEDNIISINELFEYLSEALPQLTRESQSKTLQNPILLNNNFGNLGIHTIN